MKRNSEFQNIARNIGLSYSNHIDNLSCYIIDRDFLLFSPFQIHKKKMLATCFENILTGELDGFEIFLSDFRNAYGMSYQQFPYSQTIIILRSVRFSFPKFYLRPKRAERFTVKLDRIGEDFIFPMLKGYRKIAFSMYPQLNSRYVLKVQGKHTPQELFSMPFMEYINNHSTWFLEGSSDSLLVYHRGKKIKSSGIRKYMDDILEISRLLLIEKT